jgi:hypothetical protein
MSNFQNLASLSNAVLNFVSTGTTVQNLINAFLNDADATTYSAMESGITDAVSSIKAGQPVTAASLRILLTVSDGTVCYETGKTNTFINFGNKAINENHNTRPEIMIAILNSSGSGLAERYSTSLKKELIYNALRLGASPTYNIGTFRASLEA